MDNISLITNYLTDCLPEYLNLLQQMVAVNSFTANSSGVNQLGQLSIQAFRSLGFESETIESEQANFGQHVFLKRPGKSVQTIALISHLDTVFPLEEEIQNHFSWRVEGDRVYGPGTVDIKGGTVMIFMVLEAISKFFPREFETITWLIALDATEEVLSCDFGRLLLDRLGAHTLACLVFEGGTPLVDKYALVTARKGKANFNVRVEGRSAHAGNRHAQGANAILQISYTIQKIAALTDYENQLTFNVGTVKGGSVVNRVPHHAEAEVEMRTFSPEVFQNGVKNILALNGSSQVSSQDGYPCKVEVHLLDQTDPWPPNSKTAKLFDLWSKTGAELDMKILPEERGGLSDGNFLWRYHPTLDGLGPVGNNAHCSERAPDGSKDQEYAVISSFVPKAVMNTLAIARLAASL